MRLKFCIRHALTTIITHTKFQFNWFVLTLIFDVQDSEPLGLANDCLIGLNVHIRRAVNNIQVT